MVHINSCLDEFSVTKRRSRSLLDDNSVPAVLDIRPFRARVFPTFSVRACRSVVSRVQETARIDGIQQETAKFV